MHLRSSRHISHTRAGLFTSAAVAVALVFGLTQAETAQPDIDPCLLDWDTFHGVI
jgi:hypothetical protein